MCGIAGLLTDRADLNLAASLRSMVAALRHRGPDDEGWEEIHLHDGLRLGLAHTRLSILDLSPAGHQPMHEAASGSWITYNGEVYNHREIRKQLSADGFHSTSDTETLLKGWAERGSDLLPHLRGMFAFALYDGRRNQLWLVRDRLGLKPLYVSRVEPGTWVFASELRALLASGLVARRLNSEALESYLAFGAVTAPWTLLEGVESLLPGECWQFDLNRFAERGSPRRIRYWRPSFAPRTAPHVRYEEAVERVRPVLMEGVGQRMLSDVPVGVFLSGGIDSSSVVAALAAQGHALRTFAVVFGERAYDESRHARRVADLFGTEHTELHLRPAQVLEEFDRAIAAYDQPSIDGLNTYFIAQATRQAGVKVALSGLGGDELFAGYSYFRLMTRLEQGWPRRLAWIMHQALRWLDPRSSRTTKLGAILQGNGSRLANYAVCRLVMDGRRRVSLYGRERGSILPLPSALAAELEASVAELDPINAHSLLELSLYMANMLVRDTDQMSMAHALEVRDPLLDHVLVETVAQIPGPLKLQKGQRRCSKALLVDALPVALPGEVLHRRKMGFVFPWESWLRNELRGHVEEILTNRVVLADAGLNADGVQTLWHDFLAKRPGIRYTDVLCVVHLLHWVRRHGLTMQNMPMTPAGLLAG